jgi:hypothetical protein
LDNSLLKTILVPATLADYPVIQNMARFDVHQPKRIIFRFESSPYHLRLATIEDAAAIVDLQI